MSLSSQGIVADTEGQRLRGARTLFQILHPTPLQGLHPLVRPIAMAQK